MAPGASLDDEAASLGGGTSPATRTAAVLAAGDARELTAELRAASLDHDSAVRSTATQVLGRLESEAVLPMLELALADRERGIRLDAARGLARHPAQPSALREAQLLGAYAAARDGVERAELIGLLADISATSSPAFGLGLRAVEPDERAAGCAAIQRLASRGRAPRVDQLERVVALLADESAPVVRACVAVLAEPVARETLPAADRSRAVVALEGLARAQDVETATLSLVALGGMAGREAMPLLESLAGSTEPRIALESVRVLRKTAAPAVLLGLADREVQRVTAAPGKGSRSGVLLELIAGLEARADHADVSAFAERALRRLGPVEGPGVERAKLERGLLHCGAARLADAARRWPKELFTCGHGAVPEALRDVWIAEAFAGVDDSHELRAVQLGRLFEKGPAQVRIAVLRGTESLPVKLAATLVKLGLQDGDPRVLAAALAAIGARPALRDSQEEAVRVTAGDLIACADRLAQAPEAAVSWLFAARLLARGPQPQPIKDAPGSTEHGPAELAAGSETIAIKPLSAVPPAVIDRVTQLARHSARAVREPARSLLSEWQAPAPVEVDAVTEPLPAERMPAAGTVFHVKLLTTAGTIELALDVERAPITAVRFLELARSGALDGLPVAERSAGHAVAFAPPPSAECAALRHEDTYGAVQRGSVLLQDHGRDAAGPGFAFILARAPSLDRRAVQLGTITRGLEIADALTPADAILEAQVATTSGSPL